MQDEAVRKALDAATRIGCQCDCGAVRPGCRDTVANEIAAFLRALPDHHLFWHGELQWTSLVGAHGLAAAVERAATEDRR